MDLVLVLSFSYVVGAASFAFILFVGGARARHFDEELEIRELESLKTHASGLASGSPLCTPKPQG